MMGLMVLIVFGVYIAACVWAVKATKRWAESNSRRPWLWGGLAAFVMYNLVFWDWIPTLVMHKYYCETQAGFTIYKTPEEWVKENPELKPEDLKTYGEKIYVGEMRWSFPFKHFASNTKRRATMINSRLYFGSEFNKKISEILPITKITAFVADTKNDERIAQQVTFGSGYGNPMTTGGLLGFKGWLANSTCDDKVGEHTVEYDSFIEKIISLGELK